MNENEKLTVLKFFETLVSGLRVVDLVDSLIASRAVTTEEYQQVDHKPTDKAKMRELLVLLLDKTYPKDVDIFQCFLRSMRASRADLVENMETEYKMLVGKDEENGTVIDGHRVASYVEEDEQQELDTLGAECKDSPVNCRLAPSLAPSFEQKSTSSFWLLDEKLKLAMAQTIRMANESGDYGWENLLHCTMKNSLVEPIEDSSVKKSDKFTKGQVNQFKFDGSATKDAIDEIKSWIKRLINDEDIATETIKHEDTIELYRKAAETGALVDSLWTFFYRTCHDVKEAEDIGVLRYPEAKCPHLKLYVVRLNAVRTCTRTLHAQTDHTEIDGQVHSMQFKLRNHINKPS